MHSRYRHLLAVCLGLIASGCGDAGRVDQACTSNSACAADELCATGFCGGFGICTPRPETCDEEVVALVCGCDGVTYQNVCFSQQAGQRLALTTACACDDNSECQGGQFCGSEDSCANTGGCLPIPETCDPSDMQQVCGCDGVTYDNECTAFQAGVRVSAFGACNCMENANCQAGEFCDAITCDGPGVCTSQDVACPPEGALATGCDGVVYDSVCDANRNGQRVRP
jgi:hypothetical protein